MGRQSSPPDEIAGHVDYFVDMIEQLVEQARGIGEVEVAVHLEAIAKARRQRLDGERATNPMLNMSF